jgi:hypothetical protein
LAILHVLLKIHFLHHWHHEQKLHPTTDAHPAAVALPALLATTLGAGVVANGSAPVLAFVVCPAAPSSAPQIAPSTTNLASARMSSPSPP